MLNILRARFRQGHRTVKYPAGPPPQLPARFLGRPTLDTALCSRNCAACEGACPTGAVTARDGVLRLDTGRCLFCGACQSTCPSGAIRFTPDHRLAAARREDMVLTGAEASPPEARHEGARALCGRSLKLRQVSAGGCNACEADTNVLSTVGWDLGRLGIQFVASPRHADAILVTGPVTANMELALKKTYEATPAPKFIIALGACAISGGLFREHAEVRQGAADVVPVDLFIPGCPPHPLTILDGLLRFLGKID
jgi:formate hydrogenlyase subunit 7